MVKSSSANLFNCPDLKELYSRKYDDRMTQWRAICAIEKANNIESVIANRRDSIKEVLEVGCGTGDVLEQLLAKKIGTCFTGIEIGTERTQEHGRTNIQIRGFDGRHIPYDDSSFDFVYATHVLEHVTDERGFLYELRRVSRQFIYVEVPCELHLRSTRRALQQSLEIGHINAYTPESFALRLETSGLAVKEFKVFDHRYEVHRFFSPAWRAIVKWGFRKSLLGVSDSLACRVFTYHCGALCEPSPLLTI
jgi:SAM-dependent methyltransferase